MEEIIPHQDTQCVITTIGLTKTFGSLVAVNDLHLQVMRGDIFGFLGHNGSGKTTTIRMLLGLIRPTAGQIQIFGLNSTAHLSFILSRLGAIVETPVFYPYLSGIDNLRTIATRSGMRLGRASNQRIDDILDLIDLRAAAGNAYRKYSLGMKQRMGIGAALLNDPELILLDEPTNGLDPNGVQDMRQLILHLAKLGKTIFISSHLLYEIQQVCNRVAILHKGNLLKQGYVRELLRQGEQVVVHMDTPQQTEQAFMLLQQASAHEATWITQVRRDVDSQKHTVLYIDAPTTHSAEITALLAQQQLYVTELYHYQENLEKFFFELTASPSTGKL